MQCPPTSLAIRQKTSIHLVPCSRAWEKQVQQNLVRWARLAQEPTWRQSYTRMGERTAGAGASTAYSRRFPSTESTSPCSSRGWYSGCTYCDTCDLEVGLVVGGGVVQIARGVGLSPIGLPVVGVPSREELAPFSIFWTALAVQNVGVFSL